MAAGEVSDYTGAAALLDSLSKAQWMLANRGYDAEWFRDAFLGQENHVLHPEPENTEQGCQA